MNRNLVPWTAVLALSFLVVLGCSREDRVAKHLANADRYFAQHELEMAKIEYINVLRLQGTNQNAIRSLGKIFFSQGQIYDAHPLLALARDAFPNDLEIRENLIAVYASASRFATNSESLLDMMRTEIDAVLDLNPTNEIAVLALASSARSPEESQALAQRIATLRQKHGDQPVYHIADGARLGAAGNTMAAENAFRAALALAPNSAVTHHALGEFLANTGRRKEAETELRTAAELAPPQSPARKAWARFLVASGRIADAKAVLDEILAHAPEQTSTWVSRAELAMHERDYELAEKLLSRALAQAPHDADALRAMGQLRLAEKKFDAAIEAFRGALPRTPELKRPPVLYEVAIAYLNNRDGVNSTAALEAALRIQTNFTSAALLLAELNLARGSNYDAIESLREVIERQPKLERAQLLLIRAYMAAAQSRSALQAAQAAREQLPNSPSVAFQLGLVHRRLANLAEARSAFETAAQLTTNDLPVVQQLFELDLAQSNAPNAMLRVEQELARRPEDAGLWLLKGRAHRALNAIQEAENDFQKVISLNPKSPAGYEQLARLYLNTGRQAQAVEQLREFVSRDPSRADQWTMLGVLQQEQKDYEAARESYQRSLAVEPDSPFVLNNLAYVLSTHLNRNAEAYNASQRARSLAPDNPAIADTLGWLEHQRGNYLQAAQLLAEAGARLNDNHEVQFHLGMNFYMMGQEEAARAALQEAVSTDDDFQGKDRAREYLAFLQQPSPAPGDTQAIAALQKRTQDNPRDVVALLRLGDVYRDSGDPNQSLQAYEAARQLNPDSSLTLARLAALHAGPLQQPARAMELASSARQRAPSDPSIAYLLGQLAFASGDQAWAYSLLQESARRLSDRPDVAADLAWAAFSQGRVEEAVREMQRVATLNAPPALAAKARDFVAMLSFVQNSDQPPPSTEVQRILDSDPSHGPALMAYGLFAERQGRFPEARDAFERLLAKYPNFAPATRQLAILYSERLGDDTKAYDLGIRARQNFPRDDTLAAAFGKAVSRRGDHRYAEQLLSDAARTRTNDAALFYFLGVSQQALNQSAESRVSISRAVALAPADAAFLADAKLRLAAFTQGTNASPSRPN